MINSPRLKKLSFTRLTGAFSMTLSNVSKIPDWKWRSVEVVFNESRILLAPIPFGAGIKGKLLDSMTLGLPNITTIMGAEGMHGNLPWNGAIEDNPDAFVQKAVEFYTDEHLWKMAQENGYKILENRFLKDQFSAVFKEKILEVSADLKKHRTENYLGQILNHHTLQSTKYMSQWISEKNRMRN